MKYVALIAETEADLKELENKRRLVQFQKRICFLRLLKSGAANTQREAAEMVGWKLRQAHKIWALYRERGVPGVLEKNARWQTGKLSEDEMRIGTPTDLGKKWTPSGVRPTGRPKIGYRYLYLYVSLKPFTGEVFAMFLPRLNKECFNLFAGERSKELREKTLMILDGAGAHRLSEGNHLLELSKLPAYSPELNPVERFFQELRRRLKFRVFERLDAAENYVTQALQEFLTDAEKVKSLTLYPYIKHAQSNLN